ncbi:MAG: ABC transporter ATP-binding protein [Candidatus Marinimicrobia bacterium]|nr:ABC transporter ATP-binding protein [Candidatus Neomarinimicrobiota bacterium]|tara:strand:- start:4163 stop:4864 length:702 start_codon:yes stop_codon:yes gene_type:complete
MISIQNITKNFDNNIAVNNLSLEIKNGEIYGLLGSNGAGKSTTINILLGFLKPDEGFATINGIDTTSDFISARKHIGYISENVSLYPYLSGLENLDYFCKLSGKTLGQNKLHKLLRECGLENGVHNKRIEYYSKGMRQKVGIAIALAKEASVYLLDEPASGLDPLASNELSIMLKKLSKDNAAILMASHDIFRVRETCNRIGIIKKGELVKEMNTSDVSTKELEKIYIDYIQN